MTGEPTLEPGRVSRLSPFVRRIVAPNPGMMTGPGTNSYLVAAAGASGVAVIDPGPDDAGHLDAIADAGDGHIRWILVTHTHSDHSPGARGLQERTGAPTFGFGSRDGFLADHEIGEGFALPTDDFSLRAVHTPGHASNHLCYLLEDDGLFFSGDHIMSGSTVVIAPPDGDMAAYLASLERLRQIDLRAIAPGHGELIADPTAKIDEYITHRLAREAAIASALAVRAAAGGTIADLVSDVYVDVPEVLHPVARFSVWAHLRKLAGEGRATSDDVDDVGARWAAAG